VKDFQMETENILPHTPGEWKFYERNGDPHAMSTNGGTVFTPGDILIAETYTAEDAAYIAEACNAYPALVAALTEAAREISMAAHYWEGSPSYAARVKKAEQIIGTALATAQAALVAALQNISEREHGIITVRDCDNNPIDYHCGHCTLMADIATRALAGRTPPETLEQRYADLRYAAGRVIRAYTMSDEQAGISGQDELNYAITDVLAGALAALVAGGTQETSV
jgi:hypothetical protein